MATNKGIPPGKPAPRSGIYQQIGLRGGKTNAQAISTQGKPLPPTDKAGSTWKLVEVVLGDCGQGVVTEAVKRHVRHVREVAILFEEARERVNVDRPAVNHDEHEVACRGLWSDAKPTVNEVEPNLRDRYNGAPTGARTPGTFRTG